MHAEWALLRHHSHIHNLLSKSAGKLLAAGHRVGERKQQHHATRALDLHDVRNEASMRKPSHPQMFQLTSTSYGIGQCQSSGLDGGQLSRFSQPLRYASHEQGCIIAHSDCVGMVSTQWNNVMRRTTNAVRTFATILYRYEARLLTALKTHIKMPLTHIDLD